MDDIQELFKETIAEFVEGSLESELDNELGYEPYDVKNKATDNSRIYAQLVIYHGDRISE